MFDTKYNRGLVECYNCNAFGRVLVRGQEKCPECNCDGIERPYCQKMVSCPICQGTGFKDAGQYQLF